MISPIRAFAWTSGGGRLAVALAVATTLGGAAGAEPVIVAPATRVAFPVTVEALGTARANEAVEIRAQMTERVTSIQFQEGQHVEPDAVLVKLDDTRARADVAAARAALVESEAQLQRAARLREAQSLAEAEYEARLARRDSARAALAVAEAMLADATVRAPFEGRVGLRRVSIGSLVTPETIITTLDDTDPIKLDFDVPEVALSQLAPGYPISARSAAWPDQLFRGEIASVDTRVDPVSRSVTARGLLPNPEGLLRPGMFMTVTLQRDDAQAIVVPEEAIVPDQSRQFVLVVDRDGLVARREVRIGRRRPSVVEVLSGLEPGERVVVEGTQRARPGETVEVVREVAVDGGEP